ncbi:MAG: DUF3256 family protein [Reichenbachiella sp.]
MKHLLFSLLIISSEFAFTQGLQDVFVNLPEQHIGFNRAQRDSLVLNFIEGRNNWNSGVGRGKSYLSEYLPKNGYLTIVGQYEGSKTLTYWNLSNGDKLIGIVSESCGGACSCRIKFLKISNSTYTEINLDAVIPTIEMSDFIDLKKLQEANINIHTTVIENDYLFELPENGKNIIVSSQLELTDREIKPYFKQRRLTLYWKDGVFIKEEN